MVLHEFRQITEIGDNCYFRSVAAECITNGVGGIVRNREGRHFDIADREAYPGPYVFHSLGLFRWRFREHFLDFTVRGFGEIGGAVPIARQLREPVAMVGVLVRDKNGVHMLGASAAERFKSPRHFFAPVTCVNEESRAASFEQRRVARAS